MVSVDLNGEPVGGFGGKVGPPISPKVLRLINNAVVSTNFVNFVFMVLIFKWLNEE